MGHWDWTWPFQMKEECLLPRQQLALSARLLLEQFLAVAGRSSVHVFCSMYVKFINHHQVLTMNVAKKYILLWPRWEPKIGSVVVLFSFLSALKVFLLCWRGSSVVEPFPSVGKTSSIPSTPPPKRLLVKYLFCHNHITNSSLSIWKKNCWCLSCTDVLASYLGIHNS